MKILFIQTGGTIDKDYPHGETDHGYSFVITDPAVSEVIPRVYANFDYEIISLLKKDSLDITDEDRKAILESVSSRSEDRIVITHGTDTILQTAEVLSSVPDKVIVITGSMLPEKFTTSDAKFNIGMATAAVQILQPGVYVALYGQVTPWNQFSAVQKQFDDKQNQIATQGDDREND